MGVFGMMLIAILAILGNTSATALTNIEQQFSRLTCPMPSQTGLWNASGVLQYTGATYNYPSVSNMTLTLTCTEIHTTNGVDYLYGSPGVAIGVFFFIGDYISELFANKLAAIFTLIAYVLTPANLSFLGFGIDDITGVALMFVISIYVFAYIFIGAMLYKIITPFAG
jgi:hypothetical protein